MSEWQQGPIAPTLLGGAFRQGVRNLPHRLYSDYRDRPDMPEDLRQQIPLTREHGAAFNIACEELKAMRPMTSSPRSRDSDRGGAGA